MINAPTVIQVPYNDEKLMLEYSYADSKTGASVDLTPEQALEIIQKLAVALTLRQRKLARTGGV